ncbi:MAG: YraN family protein [Phycisphaerales bacterium]|nr:MAG: YraN family protein [Phycisphaerales bacterium]
MNFGLIRRKLRSLSWPLRRPDDPRALGSHGERVAVRFLKRRKCRIIARNYRCVAGEIDLIAADGQTLVFVEVKTRASGEAQDPQEAIRPGKWKRVERAARYFLMQQSNADCPCRFDLVTVLWPPRGSAVIEHFEDAYQPRRS